MVGTRIDIETDLGPETVDVYADGRRVCGIERAFWDEWTETISQEPEECLAACLSSEESPVDL